MRSREMVRGCCVFACTHDGAHAVACGRSFGIASAMLSGLPYYCVSLLCVAVGPHTQNLILSCRVLACVSTFVFPKMSDYTCETVFYASNQIVWLPIRDCRMCFRIASTVWV